MENANKTGVRFSWWVNGGVLEGWGWCHLAFSVCMTAFSGPCQYSSRIRRRLLPSPDWIYNRLGISFMQVSKWGNSLAVRLPAVVVDALDLKEGDEIEISIAGKRDFKVARDRSKERAIEQLRQMK